MLVGPVDRLHLNISLFLPNMLTAELTHIPVAYSRCRLTVQAPKARVRRLATIGRWEVLQVLLTAKLVRPAMAFGLAEEVSRTRLTKVLLFKLHIGPVAAERNIVWALDMAEVR